MPRTDLDAIVVGAGPAGSACAFHLARRGHDVLLLERQAFPRAKCCGDGLTPYSVRILDGMGLLSRLEGASRVEGVRVVHRGPPRSHRDFRYEDLPGAYNYGLVVPRLRLDQELSRAAAQAGATLVEKVRATALLVEDGRAVGVIVEGPNGERQSLRAAVVVAAGGAASHLAFPLVGKSEASAGLGTAMRGYIEDLDGLEPLQEIHLPLTDRTGAYVLPSYGWIFPTSRTSANVGVGLFTKVPFDSLRALYGRFLDELFELDPRFVRARDGPPRGAPIRFDFAAERCAAPGTPTGRGCGRPGQPLHGRRHQLQPRVGPARGRVHRSWIAPLPCEPSHRRGLPRPGG